MIILSVEGLDKSGKHTAAIAIEALLAQRGLRVVRSEFHRYDTPTGELIRKWLAHEYDVDQLTIELIMAADKQAQQSWFDELECGGVDVLILDRYTGSQYAYALAQGVNTDFAQSLQAFMRQPDHTILLDIPADVSMQRKGKHNNGENDRYESDLSLLNRVRLQYIQQLRQPNDVVIDATRSIESVNKDISNFIDSLFQKQGGYTNASSETRFKSTRH